MPSEIQFKTVVDISENRGDDSFEVFLHFDDKNMWEILKTGTFEWFNYLEFLRLVKDFKDDSLEEGYYLFTCNCGDLGCAGWSKPFKVRKNGNYLEIYHFSNRHDGIAEENLKIIKLSYELLIKAFEDLIIKLNKTKELKSDLESWIYGYPDLSELIEITEKVLFSENQSKIRFKLKYWDSLEGPVYKLLWDNKYLKKFHWFYFKYDLNLEEKTLNIKYLDVNGVEGLFFYGISEFIKNLDSVEILEKNCSILEFLNNEIYWKKSFGDFREKQKIAKDIFEKKIINL